MRFILLCLSIFIALGPVHSLGAQETSPRAPVTFNVGPDVSTEDEVIVREGTRFAQDFLIATFGSDVQQPVQHNLSYSEHDPAIHASFERPYVVTTNLWDLRGYSYLQKLRYAVHGYVHIWQYDQVYGSKITEDVGPPWLVEGTADYLSLQALIWAGLISDEEADAFLVANARGTAFGGQEKVLPPLSEIQDRADFYRPEIGCCNYGLSAIAIDMLVESNDIHALATYFRTMRTQAWYQAFMEAFGMPVADFYTSFEEQRASRLAPLTTDITQFVRTPMYNQEPAPLSMTSIPPELARGEQFIAFGWTTNGTHCVMTATNPDGEVAASYPTFADTYGLVIWLWSVPQSLESDSMAMLFSCGADPTSLEIPLSQE